MLINCPRCDIEFDNVSKHGIRKFCSRKCANSRVWNASQNESRRQKMIGNDHYKSLSPDKQKEASLKLSTSKMKILLATDFNSLKLDRKKKRVIIEQNSKCLICGIDSWCNRPIKLAVDHVDGNTNNNSRENLRGLCPNCHSQTDTFCGRNRIERISDEVLLSALQAHKSIRSALASLGKYANSYNYARCKELLKHYDRLRS